MEKSYSAIFAASILIATVSFVGAFPLPGEEVKPPRMAEVSVILWMNGTMLDIDKPSSLRLFESDNAATGYLIPVKFTKAGKTFVAKAMLVESLRYAMDARVTMKDKVYGGVSKVEQLGPSGKLVFNIFLTEDDDQIREDER